MKKISLIGSALLFSLPLFASAQGQGGGNFYNIQALVNGIGAIINILIPILIALAIVVFFWGLVKYIWGQGKDTATGRSTMIAGLVSLFIMVTLWGILQFAAGAIGVNGFNNGSTLVPPHVGQ